VSDKSMRGFSGASGEKKRGAEEGGGGGEEVPHRNAIREEGNSRQTIFKTGAS